MGLALLGVLLSACVTTAPGVREDAEAPEVVSSSWTEARADPSCVVPQCDGERCAIWRCRDVAEAEAHPVLLAQATAAEPVLEPILPESLVEGPSTSRWWGRTLAGPDSAAPVFEIPWHNWKAQEQSAPRPLRRLCINLLREPFEKHHIFPQQKDLALWFEGKGIDIHAFTIRVPQSFHRWLHSGGPAGGQWNEAWRQFHENNRGASPAEIWHFAGELMMRFGVNGPFVPYCD
ncbi:MAG: SitA6 family polymorphic toxin lipoprotein [Archangium sp.]